MPQDAELVISLILDDKDALNKLNTALRKIESDSRSRTESMTEGWQKFALAVGAAAVATEGLRRFLEGAIEAATAQEDAINRLNQAMKLQGVFSEGLSEQYQRLAQSFQQSSRFSDDAIESVMQKLITLGNVAPSQMQLATKATLDLASALKIDLESAALLVGKAAEGNVSALQRYGIRVEEAGTRSQKFANALEEIEKRMGGAAAADINTFSGSVAQLGNAWNDFLEEVGNFIIQNDAVKFGIHETTLAVQGLTEAVKANKGPLEDMFSGAVLAGAPGAGIMASIDAVKGAVETSMQTGFGSATSNLFKQVFGGTEEDKAEILANAQDLALQERAIAEQAALDEANLRRQQKLIEFQDMTASETNKINTMRAMWDAYRDEENGKRLTQMQQEEEKYNFLLETKKKADQSYWVAAGKLRDTFSAGISKMFQDAIDGNLKFGDALKQLGLQMIKVLVDFTVQKAIDFALTKALMAAHVASSSAAAAATAAAWAVPAALVSLATFGLNAVGAAAGITSTLALTAAAAATSAVGSVAGLAEGGTTTSSGAVLVGERGPELLYLPKAARVEPLDRQSGGGGDVYVHIEMNNPVMTSQEVAQSYARTIGQTVSEMIDTERRRF